MSGGWASPYLPALVRGETVTFRPRGNSMTPKIKSGALVTVAPLAAAPERGDIVLCQIGRAQYLHLVSAVDGERYQISNNHGHVNGWVGRSSIFGKCVEVRP